MLNGEYEVAEFWRTVSCEDIKVFHEKLTVLRKHWPARLLYRGHRNANWPLRSTWERQFRDEDPQRAGLYNVYQRQDPQCELFRNHLSRFRSEIKRRSPKFPALADVATLDDNVLAALGRHHGLYTPLLDWTINPDVALYFAFCHQDRENEEFAAIWALSLEQQMFDDGRFSWGEWWPPSFSLRQQAQAGIFTWLSDEIFSDLANYLVNHHHRGRHPYLTKFVIPWSAAPAINRYLASRRIFQGVLFQQSGPSFELGVLDDIATECNSSLLTS